MWIVPENINHKLDNNRLTLDELVVVEDSISHYLRISPPWWEKRDIYEKLYFKIGEMIDQIKKERKKK